MYIYIYIIYIYSIVQIIKSNLPNSDANPVAQQI